MVTWMKHWSGRQKLTYLSGNLKFFFPIIAFDLNDYIWVSCGCFFDTIVKKTRNPLDSTQVTLEGHKVWYRHTHPFLPDLKQKLWCQVTGFCFWKAMPKAGSLYGNKESHWSTLFDKNHKSMGKKLTPRLSLMIYF